MAKKMTHNENEIDRVMKKVDEFDGQTVKSTKDLDKLMNPSEVKGNVWIDPKTKGKKKAKSK